MNLELVNCDECQYWHFLDNGEGQDDRGLCMRRPPLPDPDILAGGRDERHRAPMWPVTNWSDFCGDGRPNDSTVEADV
jgi:hypothetical protein